MQKETLLFDSMVKVKYHCFSNGELILNEDGTPRLFDYGEYTDDMEATYEQTGGDNSPEVEFTDWDDFLHFLSKEKRKILVTGYFISWCGKLHVAKVFDSLVDAVCYAQLDDSHTQFILGANGLFFLNETHHDAPINGNHYEFRAITESGEKYLEKHNNMARLDLGQKLLTRGRTCNIDHTIWPWN